MEVLIKKENLFKIFANEIWQIRKNIVVLPVITINNK